VAVNDYEGAHAVRAHGLTLEADVDAPNLKGVVVTLGAEGCDLWIDGQLQPRAWRAGHGRWSTPPAAATPSAPPAVRAGARLVAAALRRAGQPHRRPKIACRGGQNHVVDRAALGI
jgi:adenosine kinase